MLAVRLIAVCLALLCASAAPASATVKPGWAPTGELHFARDGHSAILLDDGRVLVAGGSGDSVSMSSAELFDPATGRWTPTGSLHTGRSFASMVKLKDGRVLIHGGGGDAYALPNAEIYDPRTGAWTKAGSMSIGRAWGTSALLPDGRVLVAGGIDWNRQYSTLAEVFDPATREWTYAGELGDPVSAPVASTLPDGRVIVTGGTRPDGATGATYRYNGGTSWTPMAPMRQRRSLHVLTPLADGRLLATAGTGDMQGSGTTEIYDPRTNAWTWAAATRNPFASSAAVALGGGFVLMTGTEDVSADEPGLLPSAQVYDPVRDVWTATEVPDPRASYFSATRLADGRVLIAGGLDARTYSPVTTAEIWTPTTTLATEPAVTFGDATVQVGVSGVVQLTNTGGLPLFIGDLTLGGAHPDDFSANGDRCRGGIAPGATCALDVRFTPSQVGVRAATLTVSANTRGAGPVVLLGGRGVTPALGPIVSPGPAPGVPATDTDADGVVDSADLCPATKGATRRAGCPTGLLADPSIAYKRVKGGIEVVAYYVKATTDATVIVRCSKGCRPTTTKGRGARRVRVSRLNGKRLANGTKITVTVSLPGRLTTTVTDSIARGRRVEGRPRCVPVGC
ncbi:kelch repeat-containing protein [Solirubrobacter deserti]|uniref:Choice-of-anchor D domain-containing protein n=1 Tax=Solirubrobacter deserti TaxID=2282478 RepID=A0ABT4RKR1_9ACTN|nr:kelch repeat-containing protein [Solirubrobacter deserti]MDA0139111.1 choice-of-anchor D domain-containing protein [Solirubrobacter deserti]